MGKYRLLFKEDNGEFLQVSLHYEGIDDNTIDVYQFAAYDDILSSVEDCLTGFMNDLSDANIVLSPMQQSYIRKKLREKFSEYAEKHLAEKSSAEAVVDQSPKTRYSYDDKIIFDKIETGECSFSYFAINQCLKQIMSGVQRLEPGKNGIPKNITFIDDYKWPYFAHIEDIHILNGTHQFDIQDKSVDLFAIAFSSASANCTIVFSFSYVRRSNSDDERNIKYCKCMSCGKSDVVDKYGKKTFLFSFDLDSYTLTLSLDNPLSQKLSPALTYYSRQLDALYQKENQFKIEVDVSLFRQFADTFNRLTPEDDKMVLPSRGKCDRVNSISIKATYENDSQKRFDFYDISILRVSKDIEKEYKTILTKNDVDSTYIDSFIVLDMGEMSDRDISQLKNIFLDGTIVACTIVNNIEGERIRLNRILKSIELVLAGKVANQNLVNIICNDDIEAYLPELLTKYPYEKNTQFINYLTSEYPSLSGNVEQLAAIDKIIQMPGKNVDIMLIQGPPGTGKTELILSLARELTKQNYKTLITSNVHVACDNVVERLRNNKDLALKRYTAIKGEQYEEEFIENQRKYIENQVLAGFEFSDIYGRRKIIDSFEHLTELYHTSEHFKTIKCKLTEQRKFLDKEISEYNLALESKHKYEDELCNAKNEVILAYRNRLLIVLKCATLRKEQEIHSKKLKQYESELSDQKNKLQKCIEEENNKKRDIELKYDQSNQLAAKIDDLEKTIQTTNSILTDYKKRSSLLNARYNLLMSTNFDSIVKMIAQMISTSAAYTDEFYNWLLADAKDDILFLKELYQVCKKDTDFWLGNNCFSIQTLEFLIYRAKNNSKVLSKILSENTISSLNDIYEYFRIPSTKKSMMSLLAFLKVNGKGNSYYVQRIDTLSKELKEVQFNLETIIACIIQHVASDDRLSCIESDIEKQISECDASIKNANINIANTTEEINKLTNELQENNTNIPIASRKFLDYQLQRNEAQNEYAIMQEKLANEKTALQNITNAVYMQHDKVQSMREHTAQAENRVQYICASLENIKKHLSAVLKEKHSQIANYKSNIAKVDAAEQDNEKMILQVNAIISRIENKIKTLMDDGWAKEKAYTLLFEYVSELNNIVHAKAENLCNYFTGRGDAFNNMFSLTNSEYGSLISMTTSQVASLLASSSEMTFDFAIVDEASKCKFEDLIISLPRIKHLILIGDFMQLDPLYEEYRNLDMAYQNLFSTVSEWDALNKSVFSMLLSQCVSYNETHSIYTFDNSPCVAVMKRQYRMNKGIFNIVEPIYTIHSGFELIDAKQKSSNDVLCVNVSGDEEELESTHSQRNPKESSAIVALLRELQLHRDEYPEIERIGVITGYRAQERLIRYGLREIKIPGLQIGTFDRFQGREYDLVLVSLVRTKKLGFTSNVRRMNVAFSRAKKHLIIFGNLDALNNISRKTYSNAEDIPSTEQRERLFVTKELIPMLYRKKKDYVSESAQTSAIMEFIKEMHT